jgi:hypothetical protein
VPFVQDNIVPAAAYSPRPRRHHHASPGTRDRIGKRRLVAIESDSDNSGRHR